MINRYASKQNNLERGEAQLLSSGYTPAQQPTEGEFSYAGKRWKPPAKEKIEKEYLKDPNGNFLGVAIKYGDKLRVISNPKSPYRLFNQKDEKGNFHIFAVSPDNPNDAFIAKTFEGVGVPSKQEKASKIAIPEGYKENLTSAFDAIDKGADPALVFKRMRKAYPMKAKELKGLLIDSGQLPADVQLDIKNGVDMIQQGEDPNGIYRRIAAKYPKYAKTIKSILLTPISLGGVDVSQIFK